ncbi:MAG: exonuclease SbcCD subunit D C-terminal domain-containing protein, partial [Lentisphaeria bacterium]|nr:exonuclease SbcCD subunit D C-terminal domain-containing protein [Lentisphaeria bacterium]
NPDDLIIPLKDDNGNIAAVVCALPHLRDRDIRKAVSGQDVAAQISSRQEAFIKIYQQTAARAAELYPSHPLIATGHFYLAGSVFSDSNQIVGTLNDINPASLPENIQYYALGHLHKPQNVGKSHRFRYSGSLLQMSFGDSNTAKSVTIIDSSALDAEPKIIELPCFIPMLKISGTADELKQQLDELKTKNAPCRIHAENTGDFEHELLQKLNKHCENSPLTILSCSNLKPNPALVKIRPKAHDLSKLTPADVFATLIEDFDTERKTELTAAFNEAVTALDEEDKNEE